MRVAAGRMSIIGELDVGGDANSSEHSGRDVGPDRSRHPWSAELPNDELRIPHQHRTVAVVPHLQCKARRARRPEHAVAAKKLAALTDPSQYRGVDRLGC